MSEGRGRQEQKSSLDAILEGDLDEVVEPLVREHQADLLAAL